MIHGMTLCLHRGSTPTRNPSANDVVLTILIRGGRPCPPRRSSIGRLPVARWPSLDRLLLLRQQLHQRRKRQRWKGHAPLQSLEEAGKAALGNDLAGALRSVRIGWPVKLGRPKIDSAAERKVRNQLAKGVCILRVAKSLGIGTGTVQRIAKEVG